MAVAGLLIEPIPGRFAQCLRNRPDALVEHAACVGADYKGDTITLADVGLMSLTGRAGGGQEAINAHLAAGEKHAGAAPIAGGAGAPIVAYPRQPQDHRGRSVDLDVERRRSGRARRARFHPSRAALPGGRGARRGESPISSPRGYGAPASWPNIRPGDSLYQLTN